VRLDSNLIDCFQYAITIMRNILLNAANLKHVRLDFNFATAFCMSCVNPALEKNENKIVFFLPSSLENRYSIRTNGCPFIEYFLQNVVNFDRALDFLLLLFDVHNMKVSSSVLKCNFCGIY